MLNRRRRPTIWTFSCTSELWDAIVPGFTHTQWVHNFRMSEETFLCLCAKLRPAMEKHDKTSESVFPWRKEMPSHHGSWQPTATIEVLANGHLFGVSKKTVCRCVQEFCEAACKLFVPEQICFPHQQKLKEMAAYFENQWGLLHCVGAIDGSYIPIIAPKEYHCDCFNRKGWHSIILQGVVDGKGLFWSVYAGMTGSMHDARVLRLSTLWELVERGSLYPAYTRNISGINAGYYVLGDSAYPLQNWLLKPFPDNGRLSFEQQTYKKVCRARVVVENAFGRLKGRWRCVMKRNDSDIELVKSMVLTCCALQNLCESHGEDYQHEWDTPVSAEPVVLRRAGMYVRVWCGIWTVKSFCIAFCSCSKVTPV